MASITLASKPDNKLTQYQLEDSAHPFPKNWVIGCAVAAVLLRTFFALYTHRTWEDALITVLHSENAVNGIGLTLFHPNQSPVHGFTSPLGVLLPLIGDSIHAGFGLIFIKVVSIIISGVAVCLGGAIAWRLGLRPALVVTVAGFLAVEHHQMLWGVAGMETQIAVTALLFSIWSLLHPNPIRTGSALGLCMLARPDFAMWVGIAGLIIAVQGFRLRRIKDVLKTAAVMLAVYTPWIIFTTLYYGSPIPNTIRAKYYGYVSWITPHMGAARFLRLLIQRVRHIFATLGPSYGGNGTGFLDLFGGRWLVAVLLILFLIGACACLLRRDYRFVPIQLFVLSYALYYIFLVPTIFGWYCVPLVAVTILGVAYGAEVLLSRIPISARNRVSTIFATGYLCTLVIVLFITIPAERRVQIYVEDEGRRRIGEYLHQVAGSTDSVGCEALGYIGYYSRLDVYDYPGLANRRVMEFLRDHPGRRRLDSMLEYFRPTYLVLRKSEFDDFRSRSENLWLTTQYTVRKEFSVNSENRKKLLAPERNIDLDFLVLRRNS